VGAVFEKKCHHIFYKPTDHLFRNLVGLVIVGVPLELSHSSTRVAIVYFLGVLAGSLGSALITLDERPLTGASGLLKSPLKQDSDV